MTSRKPRERTHDAGNVRSHVNGIIAKLHREQLTHAEYLAECERLYDTDSWKRLTLYHVECFLGMLRGAVEAAYQYLDWCFWIDGAYMTSDAYRLTGRPYSEINGDLSRHVWRGTQKAF